MCFQMKVRLTSAAEIILYHSYGFELIDLLQAMHKIQVITKHKTHTDTT